MQVRDSFLMDPTEDVDNDQTTVTINPRRKVDSLSKRGMNRITTNLLQNSSIRKNLYVKGKSSTHNTNAAFLSFSKEIHKSSTKYSKREMGPSFDKCLSRDKGNAWERTESYL